MTLKIIRFLWPIITTQLGVIISTCSSQKPNTPNFGEKKPLSESPRIYKRLDSVF